MIKIIIFLLVFCSSSLFASPTRISLHSMSVILDELENDFVILLPELVNPYYVYKPAISLAFDAESNEQTIETMKIKVYLIYADENKNLNEKFLFSFDATPILRDSFGDPSIISHQLYARILFGRKGLYDFLQNQPKLKSKSFKEFSSYPYLDKIGFNKEHILTQILELKNSDLLFSKLTFERSIITVGEYFYMLLNKHIRTQLQDIEHPAFHFSLASYSNKNLSEIRKLEKYYAIPIESAFSYWVEFSSPKDHYLPLEFILSREKSAKIKESDNPIDQVLELYMNHFNKLVTENLEALKNFGVLALLKKNHSGTSACEQSFETN